MATTGTRRALLALVGAVTLLLGAVIVPPIGGGRAEEPAPTDPPATTLPEPGPTDAPPSPAADPTAPTTTVPADPPPNEPAPETTAVAPTDAAPTTLAEPATTLPTGDGGTPGPDDPTAAPADPPAPDGTPDTEAPAPAFTAAALASTGLSIRLTEPVPGGPLVATPDRLDLGPRLADVDASAFVTLVNETGRDVTIEFATTTFGNLGTISLSPNGTCGDIALLEAAGGFDSCEIEIVIDDTSTVGPVYGEIDLVDADTRDRVTIVVTAQVFAATPPNDDLGDATDLSTLAIPAYVGKADGRPRDTTRVSGTNEGATLEGGERTDRGDSSVWYRYTGSSTFAGRLGYFVSPGHQVLAFSDRCGSTVTFVDQCDAAGDRVDPFFFSYVRMQPGTTVWFRIDSFPTTAPEAPFVFELFQAPNPSDDIGFAEEPGRGLGSGVQTGPRTFALDGDTYHLTPDNGGRPNRWATFVLNQEGDVTVEIETGDALSATTGTGPDIPVRLFRAPDRNRVTTPAALGAAVAEGEVQLTVFGTPAGRTLLEAEDLEPGRYYVEISEGGEGPAFHTGRLFLPAGSGGDVDPPRVTITTPTDGAVFEEEAVPDRVEATCNDDGTAQISPAIIVDRNPTDQLATTLGEHTVVVTCTDEAGNSTTATSTYEVVAQAPTPLIRLTGPGRADAGERVELALTLEHPGGTADPVPSGTVFEVTTQFTVRFSDVSGIELPPNVSCDRTLSTWRCVVAAPLRPTESITARFVVTTPAMGPHSACDGTAERPFDVAGPACLNVSATLPGVSGSFVSIPLDGGYLRFDATAVDDGTHVTVTVRPRNAGNRTVEGLGFRVGRFSPFTQPAVLADTDAPAGWTCADDEFERDIPSCTSPTSELDPGEVGPPVVLRFVSPTALPDERCPDVPSPLPPRPTPCGGFILYWASADASSFATAGYVLYRIGGPLPPGGPCVLIVTPDAEFGQVEVGSTGQAPVTVRSCSADPVALAVSVSAATTAGSSETWIASTSTTPPDGTFRWTVTPTSGTESSPLSGTPTLTGALAANASRTDTHRIRLGPSGPGIGRTFTSTITYTALSP